MARCRFVQTDAVTLKLSGGDWIEVKKTLSIGDQRSVYATLVGEWTPDGGRTPNQEYLGMGRVACYLLDWSFVDAKGKQVVIDTDAKKLTALKSLDVESYKEIEAAIEAHEAANEKAVAEESAEKKLPSETTA